MIKSAGYQEGGKKDVIVGNRPDDWPAICVGLFHDPVANAVGYFAVHATDVAAFEA
jgi:hypothetical protein